MGVQTVRDLFAPSFFKVWNDIYYKRKNKICLAGGRGCVSGDTLVDTPSGKIAIKDFQGGLVCTYVDGKISVDFADRPTCHTVEMLRRVKVENGNEIKVTDEHVFMCADGSWKMLKHLSVGDELKITNAPGGVSKIVSIEECGYERYYDFQVNNTHNYIAQGFVNHNSTKSSFVALAILLIMEMDRRTALDMKRRGDPKWKSMLTHAVVYRKVFGTCEQSVYSQLQSACSQLGLTNKYKFVKSPLKITRVGTGQTILFRGLDDPMKSRSIKFPYSFPRCVWFEEVSEFDGIEEIMDVARSIQRGGHDFLTFFSYNPPETSSNWVNKVMERMADTDPTFGFYKSDYRTVPRHWLGDQFFHDAEILRRMNDRQYRHVYLGEITGNGGTVFPNVKKVHLTDEEIRSFPEDNIHWGADFGLRDPTTLIGCYYDAGTMTLTIFDEVYRSDMTLEDMYREFRAHHFGYNYIIGDCAAATIIVSLRAMGLQIIPCKKGPDSIIAGTKTLQSLLEIRIDPDRCPHTYREFTEYEYEKNKMGEFTGRLPDHNNHCLVGDTEIWTPNGKIKIRDMAGTEGSIFAYDTATNKTVVARYHHCRKTGENVPVWRIDYVGGSFVCTDYHPIWNGNKYVKAGELKPGDWIKTHDSETPVLGVMEYGKEDVYNLEVDEYRAFVFGDGVVGHNSIDGTRYAISGIIRSFMDNYL